MTALEQKVLSYIEQHQNDLFRALSGLVKIDTQNFKTNGNENAGQAYFEALCRGIGLDVDRHTIASVTGVTTHPEYQAGRDAEHRENAVAILRGKQDANGVMIAGHMDTMPFGDRAAWRDDPLSGRIENGRIFGRGVGDDKYGVIVPWFLCKAFSELGIQPRKNILIGSYADEEYGGCNGPLALCLKYPCETYINLDGSGLETVACGGACYAIDVVSHAVTTGVASIFDVFDGVSMVIGALKELHARPGTAVRLSAFLGGQGGEKSAVVKFAVYTDMTKDETAAELDALYRVLKPKMEAMNLGCTPFERRTRFFPYGAMPADSREAALLAEAVRDVEGEYHAIVPHDLTDLSDFMAYGSRNSMNFGLLYGGEEDGGAHQANEQIECEKLVTCAKTLALFLLRGYVE